jgi:alkyl hydroperoxide reductase subunit AhpC
MTEQRLQIGDRAPDFVLLAAHGGEVAETSLGRLLEGRRGLVLTSYVLDFTGG